MPMPRLLKKFSDKNFRRRTKSMSSSSGIDSPQLESPPPLPVPRSAAASETSFGAELALRAPLNGTSSYIYDKPTPPTPKSAASSPGIYSIPGAVALNGTLYPPPVPPPAHGPVVVAKAANGPVQTISGYTNGGLPSGTTPPPPQDELSLDLQAAWKTATTDPKQSKADKLLQKIEDGGVAAMAKQSQGAAMVEGIKTGLEMVGGMEAIEKGLNAVKDGMPVLMSALDEVAKLHPFVGVAVMAFKAVWALEMKRRENDRKILLLHSEMKDMMSVLIQLKSVKDPNEIAPDGSTIQGRMEVIVETAAKDIKACGNACDTYVKKKLVVKVIKGVIWESKLAAFSGAFAKVSLCLLPKSTNGNRELQKRKEEFEFALSIHTALGVDAANRGINTVDERTQAMNAKIDMMMKMFAQMMSPQEREMSRLVAQKGTSVLDNDKALKELCEYENRIVESQSGSGPVHGAKTAKATDFADLKNELHTDPDIAMNENARTYDRKFEVQRRQIVDELTKVVEREGDRVISSILSGPHDKIVDPNVHAVWKEMGWRGSVKARHFVMGIRDHFQDHNHPHPASPARAQTKEERAEAADPLPALDKEDEWALEYIDVVNLQAISEAFDDDASGFVTTAEVNAFTAGRPLDWSLPRWIAYWAIGAHQTAMSYHTKIHDILGKMFAIRPRLLPANKSGVDRYLEAIYRGVYTVVGSLNACYAPDGLQQRFAAYVTAEEERLRGNLEAIRYDIDAFETLELVTGEGRIDRYVLPLFYLFLEHHLKLLRACQDHVLHPEELWDAADTLEYVSDAVSVRVEMLRTIFKQQKLDVAQQFKGFSFGMYEYSNEPNLLWAAENVQKFNFREYTFDESDEPKYDVAKILNYPYDQEPLDFAAYALPKSDQGRRTTGGNPSRNGGAVFCAMEWSVSIIVN
ncbi:VPS13 domain-containing protein [Mycena kentingensis (nom. inval.)]|nr:VPS13 domain-containing protein [Mycena kentingensis (nom. inval.)]